MPTLPLMSPATHTTQCALVAIVGAPNAGKSSLVNALVGQQVAIVTPKRNTTRLIVRGVANHQHTQLVLVDTPGLHQTTNGFDRQLVQQARGALAEADIIALVTDGTQFIKHGLTQIEQDILAHNQPTVVVINKLDLITDKSALLPALQSLGAYPNVRAVVPISAAKEQGLSVLVPELIKLAPAGPWLFPAGQVTDTPMPVRLAEVTRAHALKFLHDEIPYGLTVLPVSIQDEPAGPLMVTQHIVVARVQHRAMVLGKGGAMLQRIGTASRRAMQQVLGRGVRLHLHVQVDEKWQQKNELLRSSGILHH